MPIAVIYAGFALRRKIRCRTLSGTRYIILRAAFAAESEGNFSTPGSSLISSRAFSRLILSTAARGYACLWGKRHII
jgi:hypothetical protein